MEKYTLYFKMNNEYGHEKNIPIITLDLKSMDKFTSRYESYVSLFNSFPFDVKKFIFEHMDNKLDLNEENQMKERIFLEDQNHEKSFILLSNLLDVIYVTPNELTNLILNEKMSFVELEHTFLRSKASSNVKKRYDFFKYLYETYVKDKKIICMMDSYDISKKLPMLKDDNLIIAAIATDKDNLILLSKKIGQKSKDRRNLAYKFKELRVSINKKEPLIDTDLISSRIDSKNNYDELIKEAFCKFRNEYDKEYEMV